MKDQTKFKKGQVVYWMEEGEYVFIVSEVWDDDTLLYKVGIPRCGETEIVYPKAIRKLNKREIGT